jgi:hypothetical protein
MRFARNFIAATPVAARFHARERNLVSKATGRLPAAANENAKEQPPLAGSVPFTRAFSKRR